MAEAFDVKPPALTGYADQLQRNTGFVRSARDHMATEGSDTSEMEGLLSGIADGYKPLVPWITGILDKISTGMEASTGALRETAKDYQGVDKSNSATIDASYQAPSGSAAAPAPQGAPSPNSAPVPQ